MRILARNARTSTVRGEIDLIALDARELVFVEVKARRPGTVAGPERPALAVGHRKRHKLRSLALAWLRDREGSVPPHAALRFDVVGVRLGGGDRVVDGLRALDRVPARAHRQAPDHVRKPLVVTDRHATECERGV
jgi:Holliday junction resolvase-like predicted endonuclease